MDLYLNWFNLKPGVSDVEFCDRVDTYLGALKERGEIAGHRMTRRKLALGPTGMGEFFLVIEVENLAQLDEAFKTVSSRDEPIESIHAAVNQHVTDLQAALYRDFPDDHRVRGLEKF